MKLHLICRVTTLARINYEKIINLQGSDKCILPSEAFKSQERINSILDAIDSDEFKFNVMDLPIIDLRCKPLYLKYFVNIAEVKDKVLTTSNTFMKFVTANGSNHYVFLAGMLIRYMKRRYHKAVSIYQSAAGDIFYIVAGEITLTFINNARTLLEPKNA